MCLLICIQDGLGNLVVAANRDERYDRPARGPFVWSGRPAVLAGRDERAGGTWLAVNEHGLVAAVTNRPTAGGEDHSRPSRGRLPLLSCQHASAESAATALAEHLGQNRYNGFNLVLADGRRLVALEWDGRELSQIVLSAGVGVVGNSSWMDAADPRVQRARELLGSDGAGQLLSLGDELLARLKAICRDHQTLSNGGSLCLHGGLGGTVSSTILRVLPGGRLERYLFCPTAPCSTEYAEVPLE